LADATNSRARAAPRARRQPAAKPVERRSIREEHRELTRKRIISASRVLFVEKNYIATTIDDIAEAAGIGRATFYLHFQSKEEVLQSVLDDGVDRQLVLFRKLATLGGPTRDNLRKWVEQYFAAFKSQYASLRLFMFVIGLDGHHIGVFSRNRDAYMDVLARAYPGFRLPEGPGREVRRIAGHRLFYQLEQLASYLAGPGVGLDRAAAVECATDSLEAFVAGA